MYGITDKKIAHVIKCDRDNGLRRSWVTAICGTWIRAEKIVEKKPEDCRMCKHCEKEESDHEVSERSDW